MYSSNKIISSISIFVKDIIYNYRNNLIDLNVNNASISFINN